MSLLWVMYFLLCVFLFDAIQSGKIIHNMNYIKNKKIISISPGGYKGFYTMGIANYIKTFYNMDDYIFSGASAGAWISLFMTYKGNTQELLDKLDIFSEKFFQSSKNLFYVEQTIKHNLLNHFKTEDFDLSKLFIGVVQMDQLHMNTHIYTDFTSLEDAIDCCVSSSHIPLITGNIINLYNNKYTFDGGFSSFPYLNTCDSPLFHIHPSMWDENLNNHENENTLYSNMLLLYRYTKMLTGEKTNFHELYIKGYNDTIKNKDKLDNFFIIK